MPRKPRMYLPGIPAHVTQRGNNRNVCFFADDDYQYYLEALGQGCRRYDVQLHAYCLMTNHVHLLMTQEQEDIGISQVMQHIGRLYVAHINQNYQRSGTLWEGRHKASLLDAVGPLCWTPLLDAVRFRHFYNDCEHIAGDIIELDALAKQEQKETVKFLDKNYYDILDNYDPSIIRLRKKRKIILADGVLDDLL